MLETLTPGRWAIRLNRLVAFAFVLIGASAGFYYSRWAEATFYAVLAVVCIVQAEVGLVARLLLEAGKGGE